MIKLGVVLGKFAPLTLGHINLINEAALRCERVLVILSHDERWLSEQNPRDQKRLTFKNRLRWLQQTYADIPHVDIRFIDESEHDIPAFPNGWSEYCGLLEDVVKTYVQKNDVRIDPISRGEIVLFSSEIEYDDNYKKHLSSSFKHVVVDADRTQVPISATKVRENLYDNWDYLPSIVRQDYVIKVCVIGVESVGKTTLVKSLAKLFNTSWVEEYGRVYCETVLAGSEDTLRSSDYPIIAYRHKELEQQAMRSANRVCIIDTNAFVTEYYHRLYEGKPHPVVTAIAHDEEYDLILVLAPTVPWVDDGLRINPDRERTSKLFNEMMTEFYPDSDKVFICTVNSETYWQRCHAAHRLITDFMKHFVEGN